MTRHVEVSMFPELRAHKAVGPLVPSVITGTNADLIDKIRHLGYLDGSVIDLTYGRGSWWRLWRPETLIGHDLETDGVDFTDLPYPDKSWDAVCYDPPYIIVGGRDSSTRKDFQQSFGINVHRKQSDLDDLVLAGLKEAARICRGFLLVKCMDYVASAHFTPMTYRVAGWASEIGLSMHDEIIHHAGSGPGGHNIVTQKRARRAHSKLLVFTWKRVYS